MKIRLLCFLLLIHSAFRIPHSAFAEDLKVLPARLDGVASTSTMMHERLMTRARAAFLKNEQVYDALKTPEQIAAWQEAARAGFVERIGGFPERTPLKARVAATIDKGEYKVQKVTFESRPHHTVTALFYLPAGKPPFPAVLVACGHSDAAKAYREYQRAPILLARNGMAALCFDPIDQGERMQLLDAAGKPVFTSTRGHSMVNVGACLVGRNTAAYEIWDGMRALDYLLTRPEIDPQRIGCTGISGGGTQTAYLMALDLRITAAAPGCYLTSLPRLLAGLGPQDAEQNLFGQVRDGLGHAEYIMLRAPLPTMLLCATQDYFEIAGVWDSFRLAKRIYARLGRADALDLNEADEKHGFTPPLRFVPPRPSGAPVLYLNGAGKAVDAAPGGPIEKLVQQNKVVLAVDLRGIGETAKPVKDGLAQVIAPEWKDAFLAYMLGTSYLAMRAEDALVCARALGEGSKVELIAAGLACPAALHAAALEPQLFASVTLRDNPTPSWDKVVHTPNSPGQYINCVFGALKAYDLPDLSASLPDGLLH